MPALILVTMNEQQMKNFRKGKKRDEELSKKNRKQHESLSKKEKTKMSERGGRFFKII